MCPEDNGRGHKHDLIVDDGYEITLLIHEVKKARTCFSSMVLYLTPDPRKILSKPFSRRQLEGGET